MEPNTPKKTFNFLVVEDNEESALLLKTVLEKFQTEVKTAFNGEDAVRICKENKDIDLILMDFKMPVMDGYKATQKIRAFNKNVVIIAQTAYVREHDRKKAIQVGCNDFITKPIDIGKLLKLIRKHLDLKE